MSAPNQNRLRQIGDAALPAPSIKPFTNFVPGCFLMTLADSEARTSDNLQFKAGDLLVFERPFGPQTISARHYISGRSGIVPIHLVQQQTQRDSDSHQQIPHANQSLYPLISTVENPPSTVLPSSSSADLNQFEWFHGAIGRKEAEARLLHAPNAVDGLYLVRARETGGQEFVLSVLCSRNVEHYRIVLNGSQIVLAEQVDHPFASIPELIRYCSQAQQQVCNKKGATEFALVCVLSRALARPSGAVPISRPVAPSNDNVPVADLLGVDSFSPPIVKTQTQPAAVKKRASTSAPLQALNVQVRHRIPAIDEWLVGLDALQVLEWLGRGEFGEVHKGELQRPPEAVFSRNIVDRARAAQVLPLAVAIKLLRRDAGSPVDAFLDEVAIMTPLSHPNLVRLLGVVVTDEVLQLPTQFAPPQQQALSAGGEGGVPQVLMLTEFCAKGNLVDYLRSRGRAVIQPSHQLTYAIDVCSGMEYLEVQHIVHRDLAARNVLLDEQLRGKISDFGLARHEDKASEGVPVDRVNISDVGKFPVKWTAPEAIKENRFSTKSDVWSFGVLLWEIYAFGVMPYRRIPIMEVLNAVTQGYRMEQPERCPPEIYKMMRDCWTPQPDQRPTFARLHTLLLRYKEQCESGGASAGVGVGVGVGVGGAPSAVASGPPPLPTAHAGLVLGVQRAIPVANAPSSRPPALPTARASITPATGPPPNRFGHPNSATASQL